MPGCQTRHGAPSDPPCPPEAPSAWQPVGATVDRGDTLPGPFGRPLQRLGNGQNPFARLDGAPLALDPRGHAVLSAVVAAPTALSSGLTLAGDGKAGAALAELRVDWTETPPRFVVLDRGAGLAATAGGVEGLGGDAWRLALEARNETSRAMQVRPSLHVTRGIGNAGLTVGFYAGLLRAGSVAQMGGAGPDGPEAGSGHG